MTADRPAGRSLTNVSPWILYALLGTGLVIVSLLVAAGAHRELSGEQVAFTPTGSTTVPGADSRTHLSGSEYYVSSNRTGACSLSVPGEPTRELLVGRTTMVSGTGRRLPGPFPNGTTLTCNNGASLSQGVIARLYWLPEHGLLTLIVGAIPFAIGQVGLRLRRQRKRNKPQELAE